MREIPKYMNKGSNGPHVTVLQAFLKGLGLDLRKLIVFDLDYGDITAAEVALLKQRHGLEPNGHLGPATRRMLGNEYDFDIEAAWRTIPGVTKFVQPNGSVIEWGPDLAA